MEFRRNPCNALLFFVVLGIFILCDQNARAQCKGEFSYQFTASDKGSDSGKVEISVNDPTSATYTFKIFEMNGDLTMVQRKQTSSPDKVIFENLKPAVYFVKIEWGDSCYRALGGQDGIIITEKAQEK